MIHRSFKSSLGNQVFLYIRRFTYSFVHYIQIFYILLTIHTHQQIHPQFNQLIT